MRRPRSFPWLLCSLLFVATALSFLDRQVLSIVAPRILAEFSMSNSAYARVIFAFKLSYTVMFTYGGYLVDRLGTRRGLAWGLAVWSAASAAHAFVRGAVGLAAVRFLLGAGEGACFPAATKAAAEFAPPEHRSLAIGFATGGSALGALIAPPLTAFLALRFGWRGTFLATGLLGLLWLLVWLPSTRSTQVSVKTLHPGVDWPSLFRDPALWCILAARFLFDPVFYFHMFWIPQFLTRERHMSLQQIGSSLWIPFLTLGISQIFGGRLADVLSKRGVPPLRARLYLLTGSAVTTLSPWFVFSTPTVHAAIAVMSLLLFAHGIWITNFLSFIGDLFPTTSLATVVGLTGTAGGIGGMFSSVAIGYTVDHFSFGPAFAVSSVLYPLALLQLFRSTTYRPHVRTFVQARVHEY